MSNNLEKIQREFKENILKDELSPCYDCLVNMICDMSIRNKTACEKFKQYIWKRYKNLIERETF